MTGRYPYSPSCSLPVSVGELPTAADLAGVPTFAGQGSSTSKQLGVPEVGENTGQSQEVLSSLKAIQSTSTLELPSFPLSGDEDKEGVAGGGAGVYPPMLKWEFVDLEDFRPRSTQEKIAPESDTAKVVVLPGFEVAQPRKRPISNIVVWVQCFARYSAAMAGKFPEAMPGFVSHLVTVLKAFSEVEGTAWRDYDIAFREKMAATGNRKWTGMDVLLYQELCGTRPRCTTTPTGSSTLQVPIPMQQGEQSRRSLGKRAVGGDKSVLAVQ